MAWILGPFEVKVGIDNTGEIGRVSVDVSLEFVDAIEFPLEYELKLESICEFGKEAGS